MITTTDEEFEMWVEYGIATLAVCVLRSIGMAEARIIDNRADKHVVVI